MAPGFASPVIFVTALFSKYSRPPSKVKLTVGRLVLATTAKLSSTTQPAPSRATTRMVFAPSSSETLMLNTVPFASPALSLPTNTSIETGSSTRPATSIVFFTTSSSTAVSTITGECISLITRPASLTEFPAPSVARISTKLSALSGIATRSNLKFPCSSAVVCVIKTPFTNNSTLPSAIPSSVNLFPCTYEGISITICGAVVSGAKVINE